MNIRVSSVSYVLVSALASTASANSLVVEPSSPNLVAQSFDYRFDATRKWLGCYQYDVLQHSGWYPSAWYHTATMTAVDGDYTAQFQSTWQERYCAAAMGPYNYVNLVYTSPSDPSVQFRGVVQVHAAGSSNVDEITCHLADPSSPYNAIECEAADVSFAESRTTVIVHLEGLD